METRGRVLLIEDDEEMVEIISRELLQKGFEITLAKDCETAVKCFDEENTATIVAILLDGMVPIELVEYAPGCFMGSREIPTHGLAKYFREKKFSGPIVAISSVTALSRELMQCGCNHMSSKENAAKKLDEILPR